MGLLTVLTLLLALEPFFSYWGVSSSRQLDVPCSVDICGKGPPLNRNGGGVNVGCYGGKAGVDELEEEEGGETVVGL